MVENFWKQKLWTIFLEFWDFFLLINGCFWVVKIIKIVGKLWNYGIIYNLLVYVFLRIIGIFLVILLWKNNYIWLLKIIGVVKNYGMLVSIMVNWATHVIAYAMMRATGPCMVPMSRAKTQNACNHPCHDACHRALHGACESSQDTQPMPPPVPWRVPLHLN